MTVGIIGAGSMGSGIAQVAATADCRVLLYDAAPDATQRALAGMEKALTNLETKGKLPAGEAAAILGRISMVQMLSDLRQADCIIEAIVENLEVKKSLFKALESEVSSDCILATNTSSLSVTAIAAACTRPERCIGLHFFNPAPIMRLVEIAPALQTSAEIVGRAEALTRQWGKTPVLVKDTPGFIVNAVETAYRQSKGSNGVARDSVRICEICGRIQPSAKRSFHSFSSKAAYSCSLGLSPG